MHVGGIVKNTLRPPIPEKCDSGWRILMEQCWSAEPEARPSFTDITNRLRSLSVALQSRGNINYLNQMKPNITMWVQIHKCVLSSGVNIEYYLENCSWGRSFVKFLFLPLIVSLSFWCFEPLPIIEIFFYFLQLKRFKLLFRREIEYFKTGSWLASYESLFLCGWMQE